MLLFLFSPVNPAHGLTYDDFSFSDYYLLFICSISWFACFGKVDALLDIFCIVGFLVEVDAVEAVIPEILVAF